MPSYSQGSFFDSYSGTPFKILLYISFFYVFFFFYSLVFFRSAPSSSSSVSLPPAVISIAFIWAGVCAITPFPFLSEIDREPSHSIADPPKTKDRVTRKKQALGKQPSDKLNISRPRHATLHACPESRRVPELDDWLHRPVASRTPNHASCSLPLRQQASSGAPQSCTRRVPGAPSQILSFFSGRFPLAEPVSDPRSSQLQTSNSKAAAKRQPASHLLRTPTNLRTPI